MPEGRRPVRHLRVLGKIADKRDALSAMTLRPSGSWIASLRSQRRTLSPPYPQEDATGQI